MFYLGTVSQTQALAQIPLDQRILVECSEMTLASVQQVHKGERGRTKGLMSKPKDSHTTAPSNADIAQTQNTGTQLPVLSIENVSSATAVKRRTAKRVSFVFTDIQGKSNYA